MTVWWMVSALPRMVAGHDMSCPYGKLQGVANGAIPPSDGAGSSVLSRYEEGFFDCAPNPAHAGRNESRGAPLRMTVL